MPVIPTATRLDQVTVDKNRNVLGTIGPSRNTAPGIHIHLELGGRIGTHFKRKQQRIKQCPMKFRTHRNRRMNRAATLKIPILILIAPQKASLEGLWQPAQDLVVFLDRLVGTRPFPNRHLKSQIISIAAFQGLNDIEQNVFVIHIGRVMPAVLINAVDKRLRPRALFKLRAVIRQNPKPFRRLTQPFQEIHPRGDFQIIHN